MNDKRPDLLVGGSAFHLKLYPPSIVLPSCFCTREEWTPDIEGNRLPTCGTCLLPYGWTTTIELDDPLFQEYLEEVFLNRGVEPLTATLYASATLDKARRLVTRLTKF